MVKQTDRKFSNFLASGNRFAEPPFVSRPTMAFPFVGSAKPGTSVTGDGYEPHYEPMEAPALQKQEVLQLELEYLISKIQQADKAELNKLRRQIAALVHPDMLNGQNGVNSTMTMRDVNALIDAELAKRKL